MPVTTRSQAKKLHSENNIPNKYEKTTSERWFYEYLHKTLNKLHVTVSKEEKIRHLNEMYYVISEYFMDIFRNEPLKWCKYAKVLYNKSYEFEYYTNYCGLEKKFVLNFVDTVNVVRKEMLNILKEKNIPIEFIKEPLHMDTGLIKI